MTKSSESDNCSSSWSSKYVKVSSFRLIIILRTNNYLLFLLFVIQIGSWVCLKEIWIKKCFHLNAKSKPIFLSHAQNFIYWRIVALAFKWKNVLHTLVTMYQSWRFLLARLFPNLSKTLSWIFSHSA